MKKKYSNIFDKENTYIPIKNNFYIDFIKSLLSVGITKLNGGLGTNFHLFVIKKYITAIFKKKTTVQKNKLTLKMPLDSFRYFEMHYGYKFLNNINIKNYLDISSPRFFPFYLAEKKNIEKTVMVNPDVKDIELTKETYNLLSIENKIEFKNELMQDTLFSESVFDLTSSISVLEHIPIDYIPSILESIKKVTKNNGYFLVSIPVAKESFEEYIDFNEYGLDNINENGFYFGQRFHDEELMKELFYSVFGEPIQAKYISEKKRDFFFENRFQKINDPNYKYWNEASMFKENFEEVKSIDEMKGIGVAIYLFKIVKN